MGCRLRNVINLHPPESVRCIKDIFEPSAQIGRHPMAATDLAAESRQVAADHCFLLPTVSSCEAAAATYGSIPVFILPIYFIPIGIVMLLLLCTAGADRQRSIGEDHNDRQSDRRSYRSCMAHGLAGWTTESSPPTPWRSVSLYAWPIELLSTVIISACQTCSLPHRPEHHARPGHDVRWPHVRTRAGKRIPLEMWTISPLTKQRMAAR